MRIFVSFVISFGLDKTSGTQSSPLLESLLSRILTFETSLESDRHENSF